MGTDIVEVDMDELRHLIETTFLSQVELAEHFGVSRLTIRNRVARLDMDIDWRGRHIQRKTAHLDWDTIYLEYLADVPHREIAELHNCSEPTVYNILSNYRKEYKAKLYPPYRPTT